MEHGPLAAGKGDTSGRVFDLVHLTDALVLKQLQLQVARVLALTCLSRLADVSQIVLEHIVRDGFPQLLLAELMKLTDKAFIKVNNCLRTDS